MGYYDINADSYAASTLSLDMGELWEAFEALVPKGGRILDAGCGPGRDALHFLQKGYKVSAFDKSPTMASFAAKLTGLPVRRLAFEEFDGQGGFDSESGFWGQGGFDGIWACASLLHVPRPALAGVFGRLAEALRDEGIIYCSFKSRKEDFSENGIGYTCFTTQSLGAFLRTLPFLAPVRIWETEDTRPDRTGQMWTNALLRKVGRGGFPHHLAARWKQPS